MTTDAPDNPMDRSKASAPMSVRASITIDPIDHVAGDVAGLIGNFVFEMLDAVSMSRQVSSRANVLVIELVTNVMERCSTRDGRLGLDLQMEADELKIMVTPVVPDVDAAGDRLATIANADDPKKLLADTVQRRRVDRAKGGLGLIRIEAESEMHLTKKKPTSGGDGGDSGAPAEVAIPLLPEPSRIK